MNPDLSYIAPPRDGGRQAMRNFKRRGFYIIVFSGRLDPEAWGTRQVREQHKLIERYQRDRKIPYDRITGHKPDHAYAIIDDRAIPFEGSWKQAEYRVALAYNAFADHCPPAKPRRR